MKLLTYASNGQEKIGVLSKNGDQVCALSQFGIAARSMNELIDTMTAADMQALGAQIYKGETGLEGSHPGLESEPLSMIRLCAPIPRPKQDFICLGINYAAHAEESARYKKETFEKNRDYAIYFSKRVNEAVADGGSIPAHEALVDSLDYEAELAFIIGRTAKNVKKEQARDYIFGYTIVNDVSARNVQTRHRQWYFGKSLDGFTPMGPWIVTADEIVWPPALSVRSYVNGGLRQDANTELLLFGIDEIVAELSAGMTLLPGTVILTGTPAGVGMGMTPPQFLKAGDTVECCIEGIGSLKNTIV
ncbi:MAG: fumarylacetoacetate hydrolase family protein [Lachnospiraceae bacterium]